MGGTNIVSFDRFPGLFRTELKMEHILSKYNKDTDPRHLNISHLMKCMAVCSHVVITGGEDPTIPTNENDSWLLSILQAAREADVAVKIIGTIYPTIFKWIDFVDEYVCLITGHSLFMWHVMQRLSLQKSNLRILMGSSADLSLFDMHKTMCPVTVRKSVEELEASKRTAKK
jgi:protein involved in temperature-dependent protein secretion